MPSIRKIGVAAAATAISVGAVVGARATGRHLVARSERRHCVTSVPPPYEASARARELHLTLEVVDLHANSLLWGRDLLDRGTQGQVDIPRLLEGNVALQVLAATTKSPRHLNIERNDDRTDDILFVAIGGGWPPATYRSLLARAVHIADRAVYLEEHGEGRFRLIRSRADLAAYRADRAADRGMTAGLLAIEGAHALDDDPANVDVLFEAGYRMMSPSHFFDNAFGGSAHGVDKGGLTDAGRQVIARMERLGMVVDVSHASTATIDDVLAVATRPLLVSHTGVRGTADNARNLSDDHVRGIAGTGGVIGIGFWDTATGGTDVTSIARAIAYTADVAGVDHVALGSDFDGGVTVPIDATGLVQITDALLELGWDEISVAKVMGANALRVLDEVLPA